jgi:hypothetical protein
MSLIGPPISLMEYTHPPARRCRSHGCASGRRRVRRVPLVAAAAVRAAGWGWGRQQQQQSVLRCAAAGEPVCAGVRAPSVGSTCKGRHVALPFCSGARHAHPDSLIRDTTTTRGSGRLHNRPLSVQVLPAALRPDSPRGAADAATHVVSAVAHTLAHNLAHTLSHTLAHSLYATYIHTTGAAGSAAHRLPARRGRRRCARGGGIFLFFFTGRCPMAAAELTSRRAPTHRRRFQLRCAPTPRRARPTPLCTWWRPSPPAFWQRQRAPAPAPPPHLLAPAQRQSPWQPR